MNAAFHVALERSVVDSNGSFTNETWQEQNFCATKTFATDGDEVFVWSHVGLLLVHFRGRLVYCVAIRAEVAQFFFDITNKFSLCSSGEKVHAFSDVHYQVLCKVTVKPTMGIVYDRLSSESITPFVERPKVYWNKAVWIAMYMAST